MRNVKPGLKWGLWAGMMHGGVHMWLNDWASARCAVDVASHGGRPRVAAPRVGNAADPVSEVRRRADVRQALLGVPLEHEPQGEPAVASAAARSVDPGAGQPGDLRRPRGALLPGRRLRVRRSSAAGRGCRSTRRTACTARPATSRIRGRTSSGSRPRAAAGRTIRACKSAIVKITRREAEHAATQHRSRKRTRLFAR